MKFFSLSILALLSFSVWADDHKEVKMDKAHMKKEHFEEFKKEKLSHMDSRIKAMQETRECVSKAADHVAAKKCHSEMKEKMKALKEQMKTKAKERREQRKAMNKKK